MPNKARQPYTDAALASAIDAVAHGMSYRRAAKDFNVPYSTLQSVCKGTSKTMKDRRYGPPPVLSVPEEDRLSDWIIKLSHQGFPRNKLNLLYTVHKIVKADNRPTPFKDGYPSDGWYRGFLKRNPAISERTAESVHRGRSIVTEGMIRKWFEDLKTYIEEENLKEVMKDPNRVYNSDETSFQLDPKSGKVLGPKGWRNVYEVKGGSKETLTVLGTFSASGEIVPGMIVYPYIKPPKEVVSSVPETWGVGRSSSGWMCQETFYEYIANIFVPYLESKHIKRPVVLFVDGHKSHLSLELSELCEEKKILLYCLLPNATHILQPADVSVFGPVKKNWKTTVREWQDANDNPYEVVTKSTFAPLAVKAVKEVTRVTICNGFRACGLFPLNPDNVDYTKCLQPVPGSEEADADDQPTAAKSLSEYTLGVLKEEFGEDLIWRFEGMKRGTIPVEEKDKMMFRFWQKVTSEECQNQPIPDGSSSPSAVNTGPIQQLSGSQRQAEQSTSSRSNSPATVDAGPIQENINSQRQADSPATQQPTLLDRINSLLAKAASANTPSDHRETETRATKNSNAHPPLLSHCQVVDVDEMAEVSAPPALYPAPDQNEEWRNENELSPPSALSSKPDGSAPASKPGGSAPASTPGGSAPASTPGGSGSAPASTPGGSGSAPASKPGGSAPASKPGGSGQSVELGAFSSCLWWPKVSGKENSDAKNKPKKEKVPSAVSSDVWREYYRQKEEEKQRKLDEKNERKRKREEKAEEKQQKEAEKNEQKRKREERKSEASTSKSKKTCKLAKHIESKTKKTVQSPYSATLPHFGPKDSSKKSKEGKLPVLKSKPVKRCLLCKCPVRGFGDSVECEQCLRLSHLRCVLRLAPKHAAHFPALNDDDWDEDFVYQCLACFRLRDTSEESD